MHSEGPRRAPGRTASGKILCEKAFAIVIHPKYNGYQRGFVSMVYKFCDKKTSSGAVKSEIILNQ